MHYPSARKPKGPFWARSCLVSVAAPRSGLPSRLRQGDFNARGRTGRKALLALGSAMTLALPHLPVPPIMTVDARGTPLRDRRGRSGRIRNTFEEQAKVNNDDSGPA